MAILSPSVEGKLREKVKRTNVWQMKSGSDIEHVVSDLDYVSFNSLYDCLARSVL